MAVLLDSEIAHSAAPIRLSTCRFDDFAEIVAEPILVECFTGLLVPEPTTIGSELVAQHECALPILPRVAIDPAQILRTTHSTGTTHSMESGMMDVLR